MALFDDLSANQVWNTLGDLAGKVVDYKTRPKQTAAAPSGTASASGANNWFGDWGAFPQAEAKPQPGGTMMTLQSFMPIALVAVVVLALFALIRR